MNVIIDAVSLQSLSRCESLQKRNELVDLGNELIKSTFDEGFSFGYTNAINELCDQFNPMFVNNGINVHISGERLENGSVQLKTVWPPPTTTEEG